MKHSYWALLLAAATVGAGVGEAGLVAPYVETSFTAFGNALPVGANIYGLNTQAVTSTSALSPTTVSTITFSGAANATYGQLGASSQVNTSGPLPAGHSLTLLAIADFADRLIVSSPGSLAATYRWTPTIRITGIAGWTATGTPGPFSVAIASAQYVRTAAVDTWVRTSSPDLFPVPGPVDILVTLPEVEVPANEEFNYQMRLIINARVLTSGGYSVTDAFGQFLSTLRVTGLALQDATGAPLPFTVSSVSGASYTAAGISAPVPEPGTAGLIGVAGLVIALARIRRRCS